MRKLVLAIALSTSVGFALGCAGLADMIGVEADVASGDDAVHPDDFPLPPPEAGKLVNSVTVSVAGMNTVTVQYKLDDGSNNAAILDHYEQVMKDQGLEPVRQDDQVTAQSESGTMVTAQIGADDTLSLVSVTGAQ